MGNPLWVPHGVSNGDGASLRNAEKREAFDANGINNCFKIGYPSIEGNVIDIPIGQTIAPCIVSNQRLVSSQALQQMTASGLLPLR